MARTSKISKSGSAAPKKTPAKRGQSTPRPKPGRTKPTRSAAPFTLIPLLFALSVAAILFGANCRQKGEIGTPDRPIGSVVKPGKVSNSRREVIGLPPGPGKGSSGATGVGGGNAAPPPQNATEEQMLLGNPDNATTAASNHEHFLIQRAQYALSYNDTWHFPNWVAWHLMAKDIGDTERGSFVPDPVLPGDFTRIVTSDYNKSGYDRGHNCPSKDRSASREDNDIVFYMTNITPQRHEMNAGPWEKLENYSRQLAQNGNELYIICGHGFKNGPVKFLKKKNIAIPDFGWKIIVVLPEQNGNDRARINRTTRVIAVQIPNVKGISRLDWQKYIVTTNDIEQATGLHFFDTLPADVAEALKTKRDSGE